ncbi:saccharopine dehydrogenase NADP-binding domain-containing protein [Aliiglaciecola sp. 2_MG-2023]|uniref:saccharopine dehydrogenase family protein n=1 Tax=unclassified Aliiglaciecola TaxID=2593648 RepID=UPI0026E2CE73|nr:MULTISPECIES: saccharopine dehydrogenase NADP-binding domain-containing protein [unclassified Aliiglaciecola]MDO6712118.1 saccharopine dehydrogenase NADP-binding domain-containing protein [Aliiglaciecola sp. 2_MG-2023]MDO6753198.1 saccharopine dehydrogenase NADP-binding domain-containing protein [Aliiglaciecola sp. 1_MG-2023]
MMSKPTYDVIVYGATGFTGQLVAEYLAKTYPSKQDLNWAIAGRNLNKLNEIKSNLNLSSDVDCIIADSNDVDSLKSLVQSTKVVLTTVGPYQLYGNDLVALCAQTGTDYVDLCGEPTWMHDMIAAHQDSAEKSGARIVFSCGFDSIPFDLGVNFLQQKAKEKFSHTFSRVKGRVRGMKGTFSGGTKASLQATMAAARKDKSVMQVLLNPFALTPTFNGPEQPLGNKPIYEEEFNSWSAPFIMAAINTRNIHRSNYLLSHQYGEDFVYDEMMFTGPGEKGKAIADHVAADKSMASDEGPKPGEGPSKEEREAGFFDVIFSAQENQNQLTVSVKGNMDPGYGTTSKMISESAVCLAKDELTVKGGIWTTAPAMGDKLISRLIDKAGMTFNVE